MKLTAHFTSEEFAQPGRHGIPGEPYPQHWIAERLLPLCNELEVLREILGRPIKVISGYRSEFYNRKIGGARLSQHVQGRAADVVVAGVKAAKVHDAVLELVKAGRMKLGGLGLYPTFVHIDIRPTPRLIRWGGSRADS